MPFSWGDKGIEEKIDGNRHYIYTYNILSGGNPRLILFLYELLMDNNELNTEVILEKISELTPYFLDKTRDESNQRKLILDALADGPPAQTATEIGQYINEEQKSISEQLKRLTCEGWTNEIHIKAKDVKQKEVFFTLRDYFYRIWYKVRTGDVDETDTFCLAELAALLFDRREIEKRMNRHASEPDTNHKIFKMAYDIASDEKFSVNLDLLIKSAQYSEDIEIKELLTDIKRVAASNDWTLLQKYANKLFNYPDQKHYAYYCLGFVNNETNNYGKAIEYHEKAVAIKDDYYSSWGSMGVSYTNLNNHEKAIECYEKAVAIKDDIYQTWDNMGNSYAVLNNHKKAIVCYEKAVVIKDDYYQAWDNMVFSYCKLNNPEKAYHSYMKTIKYIPTFTKVDFTNFNILQTIANVIFKDATELGNLFNKDTTIEEKMEAMSRLLLLGRFVAISDKFEEVTQKETLPQFETKKLDFFIEAYIFKLLNEGKDNSELTLLFKSWILLNVKILENDETKLTRKFLEFFSLYVQVVKKEKISLTIIEQVMSDLRDKGVEISGIVLNILEAVKNPDTRKAQKWMADPLFKEIVSML